MKFKELDNKTVSELYQQAVELKKEMFNLRFQAVNSKLEKSARVRVCRRDFARIKTKLTQLSQLKEI